MIYPTTPGAWTRVWPDIDPPGGVEAFLTGRPVEVEHKLIDFELVRIRRGRTEMVRQIEAGEEPAPNVAAAALPARGGGL